MNGPVKYRGAVIEDVPDAPWTIAHARIDSATRNIAISPACPDYASDELRLAHWDALVADVFRQCDLCGAVSPTPPELKVNPIGSGFVGSIPIPHRDDCPCSVERISELDRRDSPDGRERWADLSEESQNALVEYLKIAAQVLW